MLQLTFENMSRNEPEKVKERISGRRENMKKCEESQTTWYVWEIVIISKLGEMKLRENASRVEVRNQIMEGLTSPYPEVLKEET